VDAEEFRLRGRELIDWIADHVEGLGALPVAPDVRPGDVRARLPEHPPTGAEPWEAFRRDLDEIIVPAIVHWQHPSFFAYFPSNTSYPSILGELLAAGLGVQGMSWVTSPAATEVETLMLDWMAELLDLPDHFRSTSANGGGVIQGSASEATLVAVLAARFRATGGAVNRDGDTSHLVAYATAQTHSSIEKGLRIAGIGAEHIRTVPHDRHFAMVPEDLATMVAADREAGKVPFFVCASRGTTSSLAFDPTPAIAEVCRAADVWLHVDAAMSGIAALEPEHRWVNDGWGWPTATAPTPTSGWASTSTAPSSGRRTAPRCSEPCRSCPSTCARRPPSPAPRSTTATGRCRSGAGSGPSRCG
jgi:aromatic-L-amino-acid decarboxylase